MVGAGLLIDYLVLSVNIYVLRANSAQKKNFDLPLVFTQRTWSSEKQVHNDGKAIKNINNNADR